jgi:hypothetical protein
MSCEISDMFLETGQRVISVSGASSSRIDIMSLIGHITTMTTAEDEAR